MVVNVSYSFIEEKSSFEYGQVNHALTAAMRTLMKEYLILVTQLEHLQRQGLLSLQKLWFYIQPTMRTMEILASIGNSLNMSFVSLSFLTRPGVKVTVLNVQSFFTICTLIEAKNEDGRLG